jgi:anti-anti-sigma factor
MELSRFGRQQPVLRCGGELDGAVAPRLEAMLEAACGDDVHALLLDFADVAFIDARVLALIEAARLRLEDRGGSLRIVAGGQPLRLLRLTGMDEKVTTLDCHRLEPWPGRSSSFSSPTSTSGRPGAPAIP